MRRKLSHTFYYVTNPVSLLWPARDASRHAAAAAGTMYAPVELVDAVFTKIVAKVRPPPGGGAGGSSWDA